MSGTIYVFLDESGNLDFTASGTRYFVMTSVSMERPFPMNDALDAYKYDCLELGLPQEYFHRCRGLTGSCEKWCLISSVPTCKACGWIV